MALKHQLTIADFAQLFGTSESDFSLECRQYIEKNDFGYTFLSESQKEATLLGVIQKIDSGELSVSGENRKVDWERGWSENLTKFRNSQNDLTQLLPGYFRPVEIDRYNQQYIEPITPHLLLRYFTVLRMFLTQKYMGEFDAIYEFGCGTGYNLALMSQLLPDKCFYGLDWSQAAIELVNLVASHQPYSLSGLYFDMFNPPADFHFAPNSVVITLNALEQLGESHGDFLQFLLREKPALCIHSEPFLELYDQTRLLDYLAVRYHQARGYLKVYLTHLQHLEALGQVEILKTHRIPFGSLYHDGYSLVMWRPV